MKKSFVLMSSFDTPNRTSKSIVGCFRTLKKARKSLDTLYKVNKSNGTTNNGIICEAKDKDFYMFILPNSLTIKCEIQRTF